MSMLRDSLYINQPPDCLTGSDVTETRVWGVETAIWLSGLGAVEK